MTGHCRSLRRGYRLGLIGLGTAFALLIAGLVLTGPQSPPALALLAGLLLVSLLAQQLAQRFFIHPTIAMLARIQNLSEAGAQEPPRLPAVWRPAFAALDAESCAARRSLREMQDEQALKSAMFQSSLDSIITVDEAGRVVEFNDAAVATFGFARDAVLGRPIGELIVPPHLRERHGQGMARYTATGERRVLGRRVELEGMHADGSVLPVELAITEVRLADRRLFTAYLRDLREQRRAEQRLRESEGRYRAVVEDQTELIARYDADFRLTFSNAAHARLFGKAPHELLGRDFFASIPEPHREPLRQALTALTPDQPIHTGENEKLGADGELRWFAWTNHALFDEAGRRAGYQSIGRDVTASRHAQEALRASEERFVAAAENVPDGLMILDAQDRIVFFNRRHAELLPPVLSGSLHLGLAFTDWIADGLARGPVYAPEMGPDYARRRLATRGEALTEREHRHADGRWVRIREGRMPDGGRVLLTTDITARRAAVDALRQSEARYRAVVEGQTEFILRLLPDGRLSFVNEAYCRHSERPREALLGSSIWNDQALPEQQERMRAALADLSPARPNTELEIEVMGDGGQGFEEWSIAAIFDSGGRIAEIQAVGRDVTQRKRAEAEMARQRDALVQREKLASLGSLLAGVAHELNNPLSVVVGRAIMLEGESQDPAIRDSLGRLRAAAERCARIVKSFLALAREKPRAAEPVDVRGVLDAALELAYGLKSAGVLISREEPPGPVRVLADADQLHQLFLNLIVNAHQALETVPPPRRLWVRAAEADGVVSIEIADNGPGVPAGLREQIFEPFFTTKPVGGGTGLGLSACHNIAVAHGGAITVDERPGGGARFTVTLPACASEPALPVEEVAPDDAPTRGVVLVVDDEVEVVAMLAEALGRDGHQVVTAADGAAAIDALDGCRFDAVLCDLRMPHVNGLDFASVLEARVPELAGRLLLMTGDTLRARAIVPAGLRDRVLEKPLDPQEVLRRVRELIDPGRPQGLERFHADRESDGSSRPVAGSPD